MIGGGLGPRLIGPGRAFGYLLPPSLAGCEFYPNAGRERNLQRHRERIYAPKGKIIIQARFLLFWSLL